MKSILKMVPFVLVLTSCANMILSHSMLNGSYGFEDPGVAVIYGRIAQAPFGKEYYLTFKNKQSLSKPLRGDPNKFFAIALDPGFYSISMMNSENPLLGQKAPLLDGNGSADAVLGYRFQAGKVYYIGNIWYEDKYLHVGSKKSEADIWMSNRYQYFDSNKTVFHDE